MTTDKQAVEHEPLTDDEAEAAFVALMHLLDKTGAPGASIASKDEGGVTMSIHFSADRARRLASLTQPKADEDVVEMVERLRTVAAYTGIPLGESNRRALREAANLIERLAAISTPPTGD